MLRICCQTRSDVASGDRFTSYRRDGDTELFWVNIKDQKELSLIYQKFAVL